MSASAVRQGNRAVCVCVKLPSMCTAADAALQTLLGERNKISLQEAGETGWVAKPDLIRSDLLLCGVSAVLADFPHSWTRWATLGLVCTLSCRTSCRRRWKFPSLHAGIKYLLCLCTGVFVRLMHLCRYKHTYIIYMYTYIYIYMHAHACRH